MSSRSALLGDKSHVLNEEEHDSNNALIIPEDNDCNRWRNDNLENNHELHRSNSDLQENHPMNSVNHSAIDANVDVEGELSVSNNQESDPLLSDTPAVQDSSELHRPDIASSSNSSASHESHTSSTTRSFWRNFVSSITRSKLSTSFTDGVFGNLVAKDEHNQIDLEAQLPVDNDRDSENDDMTPLEHPPTYEEASADAVPSYWETNILSTSYGDEIIIGDLPVGSVIVFILNLLLCVALQYFGFFLGYLFHTTHAAKYGSVAGLGVLMIQASRDAAANEKPSVGPVPEERTPVDPNSFETNSLNGKIINSQSVYQQSDYTGDSPWVSRSLLIVGVFLIVYSVYQYIMAIRARMRIENQQQQAEAAAERAQEQQSGNNDPENQSDESNITDERYTPSSQPYNGEEAMPHPSNSAAPVVIFSLASSETV